SASSFLRKYGKRKRFGFRELKIKFSPFKSAMLNGITSRSSRRRYAPRLNSSVMQKNQGSAMSKISGRCLCEAIVYEIEGELGPIFNCRCSKCRRWHGAAFRTRASIKISQFKWVSGEQLLSSYKSSDNVTKTFCSVCGSNLASFYEK